MRSGKMPVVDDDVSIQSSVHRVQLTLDDLSYSEADHMSAATETGSVYRQPGDGNRDPQDYRRELNKLLKKSRGTPYEKTLRKFVESKLKEIAHDMNQKSRSGTPTAGRTSNNTAPSSPEPYKIDLMSLSRSRYDSPQRGPGHVAYQAIPDEELSRLRIEELSKPLDRHRYQGVYDPKTTTNHIGRQRPPPKLDNQRLSVSPSRSIATVSSSTIRHHSQPNSPIRRSEELLERPSNRVPMQEFRQWLRRNRRWEQSTKHRMEHSRERIETEFSEGSKPRITKKSIKLAELAQQRESMEYLRLQEFLRQEKQRQGQSGGGSRSQSPTARHSTDHSVASGYGHSGGVTHSGERPLVSIALGGLTDYFPRDDPHVDVDALVRGSLGNDVFERLSARGKIHAERKKLLQEREQAMHLARHSFAPQLAPTTDALAAKHYRRRFASGGGADASEGHHDAATSVDGDGGRRSRSRSRSRESLLGRLTTTTAASRSISRERPQPSSSSSSSSVAMISGTIRSRPQSAPAVRPTAVSFTADQHHHDPNANAATAAVPSNTTPLKPMQRSSSPPLPSSTAATAARGAPSPSPQRPAARRSRSRQELVEEDIAKVRAKSRERREAQVRTELKRQYLPTATVVAASTATAATSSSSVRTSHAALSSSEDPLQVPPSRPFTPTLVTRHVTKQLVKSSFEERNLVAVERKMLRQVLSSREPSPGPGQYRGIEVQLEQRLSSPLRAATVATAAGGSPAAGGVDGAAPGERYASPGARGYSFGKSQLRSSILPTAYSHEDVNKFTYQALKQQPLVGGLLSTSASASSSGPMSSLLRSPRASLMASVLTGATVGVASSGGGGRDEEHRGETQSMTSGSHSHSQSHSVGGSGGGGKLPLSTSQLPSGRSPASSLLTVSSHHLHHHPTATATATSSSSGGGAPSLGPGHSYGHSYPPSAPSSASASASTSPLPQHRFHPATPTYRHPPASATATAAASSSSLSPPPPPPPPPSTAQQKRSTGTTPGGSSGSSGSSGSGSGGAMGGAPAPPAASLTSMLSATAYHI